MAGFDAIVARSRALQEARQAEVEALPCRLEVARLSACADATAETCAWRRQPDCPRRVVALDLVRADEERRARQRKRRELADRGLPERVLRAVYDAPPRPTQAIEQVRRFMDDPALSVLLLSGGNGCGKTTAAGWACTGANGWPDGWFVCAPALAAEGQFSDRAKQLMAARVLVVDDLAMAHFGESGWMRGLIEAAVNQVYQACGKVLLTTDVSPKDALVKLGPRIASRITDAGRIASNLGGRHAG